MPEFVTTLEIWFDAEDEESAAFIQEDLTNAIHRNDSVVQVQQGEIEPLD